MTAEIKDWSSVKQRIRERWPGLEEQEIEASQGDRSALVALLQGRLGYARPNAEQDLDEILGGELIVPEDVADERVHTGTSGPVGPVSEATDFTGGARAANGGGEMSQQPPDESSPYGSAQTAWPGGAATPESAPGAGGPPKSGDRDRWGSDPWEGMSGRSSGMRKGMPMVAVILVGTVGTVLAVRMLMKRRRQKRSRTEQVTEQARHLLEEITERMPTVEELRDRVRSLDELREKRPAAVRR